MKILVFVKEVSDTKIPFAYDDATGGVRKEWNKPRLNPADRSAIHMALGIKEGFPETHITLVHLGAASGERWIREGLTLGCDEGMRVWEEGLDGIGVPGKVLIFARIARILKYDLILTGACSQDTGNAQVGILLASHLQLPCISSALQMDVDGQGKAMFVTRKLSMGYRQRVESPLPLVVTVEPRDDQSRYAPLPALLDALEKSIPSVDLAEIGISARAIVQEDDLFVFGPLQFPKPRLKCIAAPDSSLPAFDRIQRLVEGTIKSREGRLVQGQEDAVVEELFQTLLKGGWLGHLKKGYS